MTDSLPRLRKSDRTRAAIAAAAEEQFALHGYERTTVREIAAAAGIDAAMVIRYFGSKEGLFSQVATFDLRLPDLSQLPRERIGAVLAAHFLDVWEGQGADPGLPVLLRSAASNPLAAQRLQELFAAQVGPAIARLGDPATARERAGLVATQTLGLAFCRYVIGLPAVVALTRGSIIERIGPTIQRYIVGE